MARRTLIVSSLLSSMLALAHAPAFGQTTPYNNPHNTYGSPLDTLKSTRLWTDVAPMQDFVRESRPDGKTLDYTPLTGTDPTRPKPRDPANVQALQAELEHDAAINNRRMPKPAPPSRARRAPKTEP